jgi:hypothetical protein
MRMHRTAARGVLLLTSITAAAALGVTAHAAKVVAPPLIFPVVGTTSYVDDFGDARGGGRHEGNDLMAAKRSPAVAAEAGTVRFWTTSAHAGCMLYLHGESGTTYLYIHLNNDLTTGNDNRGKCVAGVSYPSGLKDGAHVDAGQLIGYVGDSGDANGIASHLHFEVHPNDGAAIDPFPYLRKARRLLVAAPPLGGSFTLKLSGTIVAAADGELQLRVATLQSWPSHLKVAKVNRTITVTVPADASVAPAPLATALPGAKVAVWTQPAPGSLPAISGAPGALSAAKIKVG